MSFRTRLSLLMSTLVLVLVLLTSGLIYRAVDRSLNDQVDEFLLDRVSSIAARLEDSPRGLFDTPGRRFRNPLGDVLIDARFDVSSQVITSTGEVVFAIGQDDLPISKSDIAVATGESPKFHDVRVAGEPMRMYVVPIRGGGALQVARGTGEINETLRRVGLWLLSVGVALVILAAAVSWWLASRITAPLRSLAAAADDIAATGRLDNDVPEAGPREVASLAANFNRMMSTIRSSFERERRFVQDANHELRTPLTSLRANSELLQRDDLSPEDRKSILSDIRIEVDEITAISAELATLAVDQKPLETPLTVDLGDAVSVVVERVRKRSSRNVMLSVESASPSLVSVRLAQFERAVSNLLDNAVKFSSSDTTIQVTVRDRSVWVVDHGPGVSDEDKSRVFTRFFRAEATRSLPGSGLGLSIVKQFADDHAATIEVLDTPGGGATFVLRFPAVFAES